MRDLHERLLDMLEAIERIEKYAGGGRRAFVDDELIQTYIVHICKPLAKRPLS